jgi:hypothetical protein
VKSADNDFSLATLNSTIESPALSEAKAYFRIVFAVADPAIAAKRLDEICQFLRRDGASEISISVSSRAEASPQTRMAPSDD